MDVTEQEQEMIDIIHWLVMLMEQPGALEFLLSLEAYRDFKFALAMIVKEMDF